MTKDKEQITVPEAIYSELEGRVNLTQFDDVDAYATYVFEELLSYLGEPDGDTDIANQDELKDRLEALGYIQDD